MTVALGQVKSVTGAAMVASVELDAAALAHAVRIGGLVKVPSGGNEVIATVATFATEPGDPPQRVFTADLLGELAPEADGERRFRRGVSRHPVSGAAVLAVDDADLLAIYARPDAQHARIGSLYHDPDRAAFVLTDELLAKHFAVLGTTGSGKSCGVTVILRAIIGAHANAHIILLDPHDEYAAAFRDKAEVVTIDNLQLPFWLLNHEEAVEALVRGGTPEEQQSQAAILKDVITLARRKYAGDTMTNSWITVDTPLPFRVGDVAQLLDEAMGRLDKPDSSAPYLRLRTRIESLNNDRRFGFMFSRVVTRDSLALVISRMLRIPVNGRPITIIDLSGVPSEIVDVVVSLLCRLTFDFALWADPERMPPVLLVCEEAHRYVPADAQVGFSATTRSIARIAKEGRKYGVSLGLVSQRPSELATGALAQCGTLFALRMGNEPDQRFVGNVLPEAAHGMIEALPGMRPQEAIVVGEGVALPMRIRFDDLPPGERPRSKSAEFSKSWQADAAGADFIEEGIKRWRMQMRRPSS